MMFARLFGRRGVPRWEAEMALAGAQFRLAEARVLRERTAANTRRLNEVVARNHFREAVEYQLRGSQS